MLKAYRKNKVLRIPDEKQDEYLARGCTVTDMDGNVLAKPHDDKAQIEELKTENQALREEITDLQEKLTALQEQAAPAPDNNKRSKTS